MPAKPLPKHLVRDEVHFVNPKLLRFHEQAFVLRALARWVENRKYWPTVEEIASKKDFVTANLGAALADYLAEGLVERHLPHSFGLTEAGWAAINRKPVRPLLSSDPMVRKATYKMLRNVNDHAELAAQGVDFSELLAWQRRRDRG